MRIEGGTLIQTQTMSRSGMPRLRRAILQPYGLALAAALLLAAQDAHARGWYVADQNVPSPDGTLGSPFPTIQQAANSATAGDTCYIREGTYRESVRPANSGSSGSPIVFIAYNNEDVVVHGGDSVGNWTVHNGDTWRAPVSTTPREVFADRTHMLWARHPNMPFDSVKGFEMLFPLLGTSDPPAGVDWTGTWRMRKGTYYPQLSEWVNEIVRENTYTDDIGSVVMGPLGLLDSPGEWALSGGYLYFRPLHGQDPNAMLIETSWRAYGFNLESRSDIVVKNITLWGTSVNLNSATGCAVDGCRVLYHCPIFEASGNYSTGYSGFTRDNGDITMSAKGKGVVLAGTSNLVVNCEIAHSWGDGVTIFGSDNTLENCHIYDCDWTGTDCAPVTMSGWRQTVRLNTLHDAGRSMLVHRATKASTIEYNDLFSAGLLKGDLGMTYTFANNGEGTVLAHNWVHHNYAKDYGGSGIYLDNDCSNHYVHHNVIWRIRIGASSAAIGYNTPNRNNVIAHNSLYDNIDILPDGTDADWGGSEFVNNILGYQEILWGSGCTRQNNYQDSLPQYTAPDYGDFTLRSSSPCIDAGRVYSPYSDGYGGTAPDQGAYESGGTVWSAGCSSARKIWVPPLVSGMIPKRHWRTHASNRANKFYLAYDGRLDTRWDSRTPQEAGQFFEVNFWDVHTINRVLLHCTARPQDATGQYELLINPTGTGTWERVASGTGGDSVLDIAFSTRQVRSMKVVLQGGSSSSWAVEEIVVAHDTSFSNVQAPFPLINVIPGVSTIEIFAPDGSTVCRSGAALAHLGQLLPPGVYVVRAGSTRGESRKHVAVLIHQTPAHLLIRRYLNVLK